VRGGAHGPYRQSERSAIYQRHAVQLVTGGHAYRCFCTPARLEELRAFQKAAKRPTGYDGKCRDIAAEESARRAAAGESCVVRLRVPRPGATRFTDLLRGEIVIENENVDDQVLLKSDGLPTYHMANVVDDHLMGVTIIMRAEEWIPSAPKHVILYGAFGWQMPVLAHVPLLRNADKTKISKRKNPTSLTWYRAMGYLPEALLNFLALQGWSPRETSEEFTIEEFQGKFNPKDISVGGPVFDLTKLDWVNGAKIRKLSSEQLADRLLDEGFVGPKAAERAATLAGITGPAIPAVPQSAGTWTKARLVAVLPLFQERLVRLSDFAGQARYLLEPVEPDLPGLLAKAKKADPAVLRAALLECADTLQLMASAPEPEREAALRAIAEKRGLKPGDLFMGLRVGITGATASPPLLPSVDALGVGEAVARVRRAAEMMAGVA
ncbi:MAG TPA: glutamate--tRNA ligase, partial [Planctomycetota bacterium]|nr:glutamate--tRNA ligase [Planctomycetota bacterium]